MTEKTMKNPVPPGEACADCQESLCRTSIIPVKEIL